MKNRNVSPKAFTQSQRWFQVLCRGYRWNTCVDSQASSKRLYGLWVKLWKVYVWEKEEVWTKLSGSEQCAGSDLGHINSISWINIRYSSLWRNVTVLEVGAGHIGSRQACAPLATMHIWTRPTWRHRTLLFLVEQKILTISTTLSWEFRLNVHLVCWQINGQSSKAQYRSM